MSTRLWITVLAIGMAVSAQAADYGLFGSYWNPKDGDDAFGGGGSVYLAVLPLELRATAYPKVTVKGGGDALLLPIESGLSLGITRTERFDFYAGVGIGYTIIDADRGSPNNRWGWYAGGRLEVPISLHMKWFGEGLYRGVKFNDINANMGGTVFNIGLIFR